ncbi:MAG TPA: ABC transporter substrate-binding protein [Trebonia sp.]|jgi:ABC-type nitrate/sulfonate/bicarbonate transport system substrate-binding protein|nr:ABC transporter substrate-binding protein [Trebonia sp.]
MQSRTTQARPRILRRSATAACLVLVAAVAAACSSSSGSATTDGASAGATTVQLALSGPPTNAGGIFEIAEYEGFFAQQGLNIAVTALQGGPPIVEAEIAGKTDIGEYAPSTSVETYSTSHPLVAVATEATRSVTYAVVSKKFLASKGLTPAQFTALPLKARIAAIKGSSWGTHAAGGLQDHYTDILASYGGLNPKGDFTKVSLGNNAADQASFDGGAVSAYWPTAFQDQQELAAGRGVNVFDPNDQAAAAALSPVELSSGGTGWILSSAWGQANKATVAKFLKAELQGAQWIKGHTVAEQAKVVAAHFKDLPYANTLANVTATYQTIDYTLQMPAAAVTANLELAKDSGEIPADASVAASFVFDGSYLSALGGGS